MSLWVCTDCTAAYSVGAPSCPQCGSVKRTDLAGHELDTKGNIVAPDAEPTKPKKATP